MKKMATITNENGTDTVIMFDAENGSLYLESFGEPVMQTGPQFPSEEAAADYVHDSWGRGWNLRWADEAEVPRAQGFYGTDDETYYVNARGEMWLLGNGNPRVQSLPTNAVALPDSVCGDMELPEEAL